VSDLISDSSIFEHLNFYYIKTAMMRVYWKYRAICLKIDYKLRCLEYICSVSSPLRRRGCRALTPFSILISWRNWYS